MLRNIIEGSSVNEIYTNGATSVVRGSVMVKDYANAVANKADGVGVEIYFADYDFVPTGHQSDMEISDYDAIADTISVSENLVLKKIVSGTWATDQVDAAGLTEGDYLIAGTTTNVGKLVKAVSTNVTTLRYVGTYDDAGRTLYAFEIVPQHTVA